MALGTARAAPPERSIDDPSDADFIQATERDEDPLGIEANMRRELEKAAQEGAERARAAAQKPALTARQGQVVSAIGAVREVSHDVTLRWAHGLQYVEASASLESTSRFAAEVAYRFPLLPGARVLAVAACTAEGAGERCARARPEAEPEAAYEAQLARPTTDPTLAVLAERIVDARGPALALRLAPLRAGGRVALHVEYVAEQPLRGGVVRLALPARGFDPRTAPTRVSVQAPDLALRDEGELEVDAWVPLELAARFAPRSKSAEHDVRRAACGPQRRCERRWEARALPDTPPAPVTLWIFVDRSPSMEGPARGRVVPVVQALRAALPAGSTLRVAVFDDRARELETTEAPKLDRALREALLQAEGASTRLSSALALAQRDWGASRLPVRAVVVSDGRLSAERGELEAARRFARRGVPTWLVGLEADRVDPQREPLLEALGARFIPASTAADRALDGGERAPLRERLSPVVHARAGVRPPPGEQHLERRQRPGRAPRDATAERLLSPDPASGWTSLGPEPAPLWPQGQPPAPAAPYLDAPPPPAEADTGMPAESVLDMLRDQLVPKARACLRRDRRGRADYAVRAAFVFRLERREILDAEVQGDLERPLRHCLRDVLAELRVPTFTGRLRIRYPIYTERAPEPPKVELEADTAARIERLFHSERPP